MHFTIKQFVLALCITCFRRFLLNSTCLLSALEKHGNYGTVGCFDRSKKCTGISISSVEAQLQICAVYFFSSVN